MPKRKSIILSVILSSLFVLPSGSCKTSLKYVIINYTASTTYPESDIFADYILGENEPLHLRLPQSYVLALWKNAAGKSTRIMLRIPLKGLDASTAIGRAGHTLPAEVVDIEIQTNSNRLSGQKLLDALMENTPNRPASADDAGYEVFQRQNVVAPFNELHVRTQHGQGPLFILCDDKGSVPNPMCVTDFRIGTSTAEQVIVRRNFATTAKSVLAVTQQAELLLLTYIVK